MKGNAQEVMAKLDLLMPKLSDLDQRRWSDGEEWRAAYMQRALKVLVENVEGLTADARLTAAWYCSLLDRQVRFEKVWSDGMDQVVDYLRGSERLPQIRLPETRYFEASRRAFGNKRQGFFFWLRERVLQEKNTGEGSFYRLVGRVAKELLAVAGPEVDKLCRGEAGLLGNWKRLWMFVMLLRRDNRFYKRLVQEAASQVGDSGEFMRRWYGESFPETESELPVDSRIRTFFRQLGIPTGSLRGIAEVAHQWGKRNQVPPSFLDTAFVPGYNEELFQFGLRQGLRWEKWWQGR